MKHRLCNVVFFALTIGSSSCQKSARPEPKPVDALPSPQASSNRAASMASSSSLHTPGRHRAFFGANAQALNKRSDVVQHTYATFEIALPREWTETTARAQGPGAKRRISFEIPGPGGNARLFVWQGSAKRSFQQRANVLKSRLFPSSESIAYAQTERENLRIDRATVEGTYHPQGSEHLVEGSASNYRMVLVRMVSGEALVELRIVGPASTLEAWAPELDAMVATAKAVPS